jgi:hypothetical protein
MVSIEEEINIDPEDLGDPLDVDVDLIDDTDLLTEDDDDLLGLDNSEY